ncbi:hypothetical protein PMI11_05586 [Rhizobium sp. CF142]|nr:hypothetical protein PMI11_05586 [Rhizobium sp. CF142]
MTSKGARISIPEAYKASFIDARGGRYTRRLYRGVEAPGRRGGRRSAGEPSCRRLTGFWISKRLRLQRGRRPIIAPPTPVIDSSHSCLGIELSTRCTRCIRRQLPQDGVVADRHAKSLHDSTARRPRPALLSCAMSRSRRNPYRLRHCRSPPAWIIPSAARPAAPAPSCGWSPRCQDYCSTTSGNPRRRATAAIPRLLR